MGFEDIGSPKSGEIVMGPDFDNYVIKLIISGDGNKLSTEIKNVVDIKYNEQQPLIAFVYDNDEMSVPTLDDFKDTNTYKSRKKYIYDIW